MDSSDETFESKVNVRVSEAVTVKIPADTLANLRAMALEPVFDHRRQKRYVSRGAHQILRRPGFKG